MGFCNVVLQAADFRVDRLAARMANEHNSARIAHLGIRPNGVITVLTAPGKGSSHRGDQQKGAPSARRNGARHGSLLRSCRS